MSIPSPDSLDRVHSRDITMTTYSVDDDHILLEGRLHEKRCKDNFLFTGEKKPSGDLHDMSIRMLIKIPELQIEDIEVVMTTFPRDDCPDIKNSLDAIKGMKIGPGFTMKVRSLLSGVKGCTHLTHLLQTMAPAAMQGMWAYTAQKPPHERADMLSPDMADRVMKKMKNSCYAWREDGRVYTRMEKYLQKKRGNQS